MKCPYCGNPDTKVIDSRPAEDGELHSKKTCLRYMWEAFYNL